MPTTLTQVSSTDTLLSVLQTIFNRPVGEILLLLIVSTFLLFLLISSLSFVISRMKGDVKLNLFSCFKIGKQKISSKENSEIVPKISDSAKEKQDINIVITNTASNRNEDIRKENELLNELSKDTSVIEEEFEDQIDSDEEIGNLANNDLILIISKSVRFGSEIAKCKDILLIKSQMNAAEVRAEIIEGQIVKEYMELLYRKKGPSTNIQEDQSYRIFYEIVHSQMHRNALAVLRKILKDNHLMRFTDEKYHEYVDTQCEKIMMSMQLSINSALPSFLNPGREEVNMIMDKCSPDIIETFQGIFIEARALAYKTELIIRKKEKAFDEEIRKLTGIHNALVRADFQNEDLYGYTITEEET